MIQHYYTHSHFSTIVQPGAHVFHCHGCQLTENRNINKSTNYIINQVVALQKYHISGNSKSIAVKEEIGACALGTFVHEGIMNMIVTIIFQTSLLLSNQRCFLIARSEEIMPLILIVEHVASVFPNIKHCNVRKKFIINKKQKSETKS